MNGAYLWSISSEDFMVVFSGPPQPVSSRCIVLGGTRYLAVNGLVETSRNYWTRHIGMIDLPLLELQNFSHITWRSP